MTKAVYADIAARVARIANAQGNGAAGEYLEGVMYEEFEGLRQEIRDLKKDMTDAVETSVKKVLDPEMQRLQELAGIKKR